MAVVNQLSRYSTRFSRGKMPRAKIAWFFNLRIRRRNYFLHRQTRISLL